MKEGGGGDHLSVGVKLPRRGGIRPVSKRNLYQIPPGELVVSIAFLYAQLYPCLFLLSIVVASVIAVRLVFLFFGVPHLRFMLFRTQTKTWKETRRKA